MYLITLTKPYFKQLLDISNFRRTEVCQIKGKFGTDVPFKKVNINSSTRVFVSITLTTITFLDPPFKLLSSYLLKLYK